MDKKVAFLISIFINVILILFIFSVYIINTVDGCGIYDEVICKFTVGNDTYSYKDITTSCGYVESEAKLRNFDNYVYSKARLNILDYYCYQP